MITELVVLAGLCATLPAGDRWWSRVSYLASDEMKGRDAASPEFRRAAEWVAQEMKGAGLKPAFGKEYLQRIAMTKRWVVEAESRVTLIRGGKSTTLEFGRDILVGSGSPRKTARTGLVFIGYGLRVPEIGHDDFRGIDVRGKLVVFLGGAPKALTGALLAHARNARERTRVFEELGAAGAISINTTVDVPWERTAAQRGVPSMVALDDPERPRTQRLGIGMNPARASVLFEGAPASFDDLIKIMEKGEPLPAFALAGEIEAEVTVKSEPAESWNVGGMIRGTDPREAVAVTAHLDHLGVNPSLKGDQLFNGAMDNASGVAALLEVADAVAAKKRPRRSIVFVAVTAEEKGLLGSRWFAAHPPKGKTIVADLNLDMFMPLFPLKKLTAIGMEESDLGADVEAVGRELGIAVETDPEPARNRFTRSDQYSFIRRGIPSLAFKFGYDKGSPEEKLTAEWNRVRYHSVSDDLLQPVDKDGAGRFCGFLGALVSRVAGRADKPQWREASFFRRFAE